MNTIADTIADTTREAVDTVEVKARGIKRWDESRPNVPGEHLIAAAIGLALLGAAGKARSPLKTMLLTAVGTAALARAASGQGGVSRVAGWLVGKK